ncbi:MAG: helix-turn-helix domain-containing protein [Candidatus Fimivivens sp.]
MVGVTDGAVSNWEQGVNTPRMGSIQKIADYFGVMKSDIIESEEVLKPLLSASNIRPIPATRTILLSQCRCRKLTQMKSRYFHRYS